MWALTQACQERVRGRAGHLSRPPHICLFPFARGQLPGLYVRKPLLSPSQSTCSWCQPGPPGMKLWLGCAHHSITVFAETNGQHQAGELHELAITEALSGTAPPPASMDSMFRNIPCRYLSIWCLGFFSNTAGEEILKSEILDWKMMFFPEALSRGSEQSRRCGV